MCTAETGGGVMKNPAEGRPRKQSATTAQLFQYMEYAKNPVTKASYRQAIANRIDRASRAND